ncbi:MAG: response regulator, partial [bacterium]
QSFASLSVAAIERESAFHVARESESRYWEILENLLLISVGLDLQGKITFCNDFLLQRTGWSREEVLGRDWFEIFLPPETRGEVHDLYMKMIAGGGWRPHHLNEIVTREGARRLISWNNTVLRDPEGHVIGTISIGEDITARKMAEEQLHQSEKLEALGRLSSGVSHDFNNSLGIIHGCAEVLERLLRGDDTDPQILDYIDFIQKSAMSAAQTVKRLQDFSRKREDRPVGVADLNVVIREVAEMTSPRWRSEAEAGGVPFEFIVRPLARRPLVSGVETELHEVLINLINNSLDAMPGGGRLFVTTEDTRDGPKVSVKDNGAGMTPEVKARAFEPFFSTKGEQGTGMGLSMVFGIVKRYGGSIAIESEEGEGTEVGIVLPSSEIQADAPDDKSISPAGPANILVVEDEPEMARVVRDLLEEGGYTVEAVHDGATAVRAFSDRLHDLVISDLAMPGMSGAEVARRIKEISPATPVFILTGWQAVMDPDQMAENGIDRVMVKPVKKVELHRNVSEVLRERR